MNFDFSKSKFLSIKLQQSNLMTMMNIDEDSILDYLHPTAFAAKLNLEDIPNWNVIRGELETLESMNCWDVVPHSEANGKNILNGVWAFEKNYILMELSANSSWEQEFSAMWDEFKTNLQQNRKAFVEGETSST